MTSTPLFVDDRTGSVELEPLITAPTEIIRLSSADFAIWGNGPEGMVTVGIERKAVPDLLQSMESGRFSGHQLPKMLNDYNYVYLMVEGLWRPRSADGLLEVWKRNKWVPYSGGSRRYMARDIGNYLNTLAIICGIHVWRTDNPMHSGQWLSDLYRWWQKPWERHRSHFKQFNVIPPPKAMLRKPTLLHRIVKEFEGIGWDKGKALEGHFGTLSNLLFASEKDIKKVPGIGKKLAARLYRELEELR